MIKDRPVVVDIGPASVAVATAGDPQHMTEYRITEPREWHTVVGWALTDVAQRFGDDAQILVAVPQGTDIAALTQLAGTRGAKLFWRGHLAGIGAARMRAKGQLEGLAGADPSADRNIVVVTETTIGGAVVSGLVRGTNTTWVPLPVRPSDYRDPGMLLIDAADTEAVKVLGPLHIGRGVSDVLSLAGFHVAHSMHSGIESSHGDDARDGLVRGCMRCFYVLEMQRRLLIRVAAELALRLGADVVLFGDSGQTVIPRDGEPIGLVRLDAPVVPSLMRVDDTRAAVIAGALEFRAP
jgi:hypothetical protein